MNKKTARPSTITIICIVSWFLSLFYLLIGLLGLVALTMPEALTASGALTASDLQMLVSALVVLLIPISIFALISFYGLWKMKKWGWELSFIISIIFIISELIFVNLGFPIIIEIIIVYILWINRRLFNVRIYDKRKKQ
jgi:uncharacterized membrane protein (DUF2068 family)